MSIPCVALGVCLEHKIDLVTLVPRTCTVRQVLASVQPGDCLLVWTLDRLGRSLPHLLQIVLTLQTQGVACRSLTALMETTTPHGAFLCSRFGTLAQSRVV